MRTIARCLCVALCLSLPVVWVGCAATPERESTGEYVDDAVITTKIKTALGADKMASLFQVGVETHKGVVELSGTVESQEAADQAVVIAQKVKGVREVKSALVVKPQ